jgi:hypothetical protein
MDFLKLFLALPLAVCGPLAVFAKAPAQEKGRIRLESLDRLSAKAKQTVDVDIDGNLIKVAALVLSDDDDEEKVIKDLALSLRGVYVRRFEFKEGNQYSDGDLADIRTQVRAPGWSKMVDVSGSVDIEVENAEIYVATSAGQIDGIVVVVAEDKSLTVANIVGMVDLQKIRKLDGSFGIPKIRIKKRGETVTPEKKP